MRSRSRRRSRRLRRPLFYREQPEWRSERSGDGLGRPANADRLADVDFRPVFTATDSRDNAEKNTAAFAFPAAQYRTAAVVSSQNAPTHPHWCRSKQPSRNASLTVFPGPQILHGIFELRKYTHNKSVFSLLRPL